MSDSQDPLTLDRRRSQRDRVLQRAELLIGPGVHTCLLLDQTARGVRFELPTPMPVPERFAMRFTDGRRVTVMRRWAVGRRIGAEILDAEALPGSQVERLEAMLRLMETAPLARVIGTLRAEHYLGRIGLAELASETEAAYGRLAAALRALATSPGEGAG